MRKRNCDHRRLFMERRIVNLCLSVSLIFLFVSCSSKNVSSSGEVASSSAEEVLPDAIKTIPLERSFDRPAGGSPSNLPQAQGTASGSHALDDVFFDFDRFEISKDAMSVLDVNAGW